MNTYLKRNHYKILNMNTLNKDLRRTVSYQKEWENSECWNLSLKYSKLGITMNPITSTNAGASGALVPRGVMKVKVLLNESPRIITTI